MCALIFAVLAGGMTTTASDLSRPLGDPQLERPILRSLGVYWIIQGDDNQNAFIALEYRKAGSSSWRTAARLFRVERRAHLMERSGSELEVPDDGWLFAGSALLLEPRAAYELRLTLKDPDGGKATRTLRASTRSEPRLHHRARPPCRARLGRRHRDPLAATTIHPFRIVHRWTEHGQAKTHTELITKLPVKYAIRTSGEPEIVSVAYEMATSH